MVVFGNVVGSCVLVFGATFKMASDVCGGASYTNFVSTKVNDVETLWFWENYLVWSGECRGSFQNGDCVLWWRH